MNQIQSHAYNGITSVELDELSAQTAISLITSHTDYDKFAAAIEIRSLHKSTPDSFSRCIDLLFKNHNHVSHESEPLVSSKIHDVVMRHKQRLDDVIQHKNDYQYDYFGIQTLKKSYLLKMGNEIVERPQYMLMRVSVGIHQMDVESAVETYRLLSEKFFIHASPTLFNAGTCKPQLSSCFLLPVEQDSIEGIYDTMKVCFSSSSLAYFFSCFLFGVIFHHQRCALISKFSGGIGLSIHNVRSRGSQIKSTNGQASGIIPMLRVFNNTARHVNQGGGKRKGSFAIYLETWHADIFEFLCLKKNHGQEEERCRDLFLALWVSDLFMNRVLKDADWSLMCPDECKNLHSVFGQEFEELYMKYESSNMFKKKIKARQLWSAIIASQIETGQPFMCYKDACNRKSNQKNLGTIQCSNLCTEIVQFSSATEIAVCNLASIALPKFVNVVEKKFDFDGLIHVTRIITKNLNKIIDLNFYPLEECKISNERQRPIGIGVQGLADTFLLLRMPFDSVEANNLNRDIFEAIYFAAITTSNALAEKYGAYATFTGSPASQGLLQFDLWQEEKTQVNEAKYHWSKVKKKVMQYGLRNSLVTAPMPTASTSQILGNNECFEPYTSNVYIRRTLAGEFIVINKHLVKDLMALKLWNEKLKNKILAHNGSIQNIELIPETIKKLYKTVWEIKQKHIIDMAASRGPFIDQSQSMNIHMIDPSYSKMTSMHFHGWKKGLKTGMYYLRTQAAVDAIKFTVPVGYKPPKEMKKEKKMCVLDSEECIYCGS